MVWWHFWICFSMTVEVFVINLRRKELQTKNCLRTSLALSLQLWLQHLRVIEPCFLVVCLIINPSMSKGVFCRLREGVSTAFWAPVFAFPSSVAAWKYVERCSLSGSAELALMSSCTFRVDVLNRSNLPHRHPNYSCMRKSKSEEP